LAVERKSSGRPRICTARNAPHCWSTGTRSHSRTTGSCPRAPRWLAVVPCPASAGACLWMSRGQCQLALQHLAISWVLPAQGAAKASEWARAHVPSGSPPDPARTPSGSAGSTIASCRPTSQPPSQRTQHRSRRAPTWSRSPRRSPSGHADSTTSSCRPTRPLANC